MEEENKSIKKKKQVNAPNNPSIRAKFYEDCQCPLKEEYPHCKKRMKNGTCIDRLIESYYPEEENI
jgi:hypothetical protein